MGCFSEPMSLSEPIGYVLWAMLVSVPVGCVCAHFLASQPITSGYMHPMFASIMCLLACIPTCYHWVYLPCFPPIHWVETLDLLLYFISCYLTAYTHPFLCSRLFITCVPNLTHVLTVFILFVFLSDVSIPSFDPECFVSPYPCLCSCWVCLCQFSCISTHNQWIYVPYVCFYYEPFGLCPIPLPLGICASPMDHPLGQQQWDLPGQVLSCSVHLLRCPVLNGQVLRIQEWFRHRLQLMHCIYLPTLSEYFKWSWIRTAGSSPRLAFT